MKEFMQKASNVCKIIFGYGLTLMLFAGGLSFFGYVFALIAGGQLASDICQIIYKQILPVIIRATSALILLGLLSMYLAGEKALTPSGKKKSPAGSQTQGDVSK